LQDSLTGVTAVDPGALIQFLNSHHFVKWNLGPASKILLTLRSDIPIAAASFRAECRGDCVMACLTAWTFCGDRTLRGLPGGSFFKAEPVTLTF
jgi:hypothetical protein